ncbi:MAG: GNAT family N-acetyltransferase [Anaerolineae bacterium]|nr:GNAT family N-acetyltransferase [Anaerolineae bacterium]
MPVQICHAQHTDIPAILAIYNDAVLNTTASYDYEPNTLQQRTLWFEQHQQQGFPVLVAVDDTGQVVGWGSLSRFREKIGYQFTVEHSVYVAADYRGQGIGRFIVQTLIDEACALGKHVIIGGVDGSNAASLRLHQSLGFEEVAHFKQVGYKFDRWLDLVFLQRVLRN